MDEIDRINLMLRVLDTQKKDLSKLTNIEKTRLSKLLNKQLRMSSKELIKIMEIFPEHRYWLISGEEIIEAGQISPMTKLAQESYKKQGGDS